jgi:tripartite-type tricarboxylate transporter receptor subunit TctC
MDLVAKVAPDGYTVGFGAISTTCSIRTYTRTCSSTSKDFTPVRLPGTSAIMLQVILALPIKSVAELIDYAQSTRVGTEL